MARRQIEDKNIRTLTKHARDSSYMISLPVDIIRKFGWQDRQQLELKVDEKAKRITIEDWKSPRQR